MGKSLAEMRSSTMVGRPERTYELCLAGKVVSEIQTILGDLDTIRQDEAARADGVTLARPRRAAESSNVTALVDRLKELQSVVEEHTGVLTLVGIDEGDWRTWCDEHPPREGNVRDDEVAYGYCNADDLIAELGTYATLWNGDKMAAGDWEFIRSTAAPGDVTKIASIVVQMHETVVNLGKLLSNSLGILDVGTASGSPFGSKSDSASCTDGSPQKPTPTTTPPATSPAPPSSPESPGSTPRNDSSSSPS